jgi:hypothetical protein
MAIFAYIFKNLGVLVGIAEAIIKVAAAIISLTPTKKDDKVIEAVDKIFSKVKAILYGISDKLAGK